MAGFQVAVSAQMAPGIEGGWSGANPHFTLTNPDEGMWVVGTTGAIIGRFAWGNVATGRVTSAHPGVAVTRIGFVHRDQPVYITGLNLDSSMTLTSGQMIDLLEDGPVWARFAAGATTNMKVYASYADGSCSAAATGAAGTTTYSVTTTNASPNLTAVGAGAYAGQPISGTGIPAGAYLVSVSGTTAVMSANATASGTVTATATTDYETQWTVRSTCLSGEVAKISVRG